VLVHSLGVLQNVDKAQTKVRSKKDNVAGKFIGYCSCADQCTVVFVVGVTLPQFECVADGTDSESASSCVRACLSVCSMYVSVCISVSITSRQCVACTL
jgi:hypothetical protein